jgi:hypothetical protein
MQLADCKPRLFAGKVANEAPIDRLLNARGSERTGLKGLSIILPIEKMAER